MFAIIAKVVGSVYLWSSNWPQTFFPGFSGDPPIEESAVPEESPFPQLRGEFSNTAQKNSKLVQIPILHLDHLKMHLRFFFSSKSVKKSMGVFVKIVFLPTVKFF